MHDEHEPEFVPFSAPVVPQEKKKKKEPPKKEKEPPKEKPLKTITAEEIKTFTWQMERFQIMLADSNNVLVALMLDSAPSDPIKEALLKFTSQFEAKFKTEIEGFRGNVSWFRPGTELADESFNMFLMRPQCLPLTEEELKSVSLTETEAKVVKVAQEICADTGYFFLATLLDEMITRYKMPREKVLKSFFNLHRKKSFIPVHIEEVGKEVEKRKLWRQISVIDGLAQEEYDFLMEDLLASNEESRNSLIASILEFKKKDRGTRVREELTKRKRVRKERDEWFKQVDEYLRLSDFTEVVKVFDYITQLSMEIGEISVAQALTEKAQVYRQELNQMAQRVPVLRSQRNEALNQAELFELSGNYEDAAKQFDYAASLSVEIGDIDKAKDFIGQAQRLMSLAELAKLRERLK
ncbi:MAG TPA: hypothetical protein VMV49_07180 [Candidatus Deferrimicrobium sp.]|nr:hypothetical protein [Candidatus Deferrimicrobium sp.]